MLFDSLPLLLSVVLITAAVAWLASMRLADVSIVDAVWSIFILEAACCYAVNAANIGVTGYAVLLLVTAWALRLSAHIVVRHAGRGEDRRYRAMRRRHEPGFRYKSAVLVFLPQALLAGVISLPLYYGITGNRPPAAIHAFALALWLAGFAFEAVGDWQLARFLRQRNSDGRVLDTGLWHYTRHPNYFGEACIWWAFWLFAAANGAWWTIVSPVAITVLLLRVSGVTLLEKTIVDRRPAYRDYIRRTNAFLPWPPRPRANGAAA